jgi:hypothetical protein
VNDGGALCRDPVMRWVLATGRSPGLPLRPARWPGSRTKRLSRPENFIALADLPNRWKPNRKAVALKDPIDRGKTPQIPSRQQPAEPKMVNKNLTIVN